MTNKTRKGTVMNVEIAQRLAELRRERGFSQEDLANRLGLSRQAVSKWERAESAPDMGNLIALADLYEVTIDELLRVSPEVEEDVLYESQERAVSAESAAAEAADAAREAAVRAEAAAVAVASAANADDKAEPAKVVVEVNAPTPMPSPQPVGTPEFMPGAAIPQGTVPPYGAVPPQPFPPASSVPIAPSPTPQPKDPLRTFPYPLLCAVVFLLVGFAFGWWHPAWVIFFTIPFYYWIISVLEADPGFQEWRAERAERLQRVSASGAAYPAGASANAWEGNAAPEAPEVPGDASASAWEANNVPETPGVPGDETASPTFPEGGAR